MELTWLSDTPQSRSRTRALRACSQCQRRKKRCHHTAAHARLENRPTQTQIPKNNNIAQYGRAVTEHSDVPETQSAASATSVSPGHSMPERFVGDLNPEAVIREKLDGKSVNPLRDKIGLWISSPIVQSDNEGRGNFSSVESPPAVQSSQPIPSILHQRYTSAMKACDRLPPQTLEKLIPIYFSKVNHILPLIDKNSFLRAQSKGTSTFLERAMCLVAAKYKRTSFDLQLVSGEPIVTSRRFCSDIYNGLVAAMDARLEVDRVARIRILALMSLHCEGYDGAEAASMHLCQAIHLAQTAGLHLDRPGRAAEDSLSTLFWCLWTLDKMHASLCGRPILLADRDIGIEKPNVNSCKSRSAFDVWLAISDLLATVISFYRPSASDTMGWEEDFPTFEEIVGDSIQGDLDFTTLGLLEVYYHAVSILSCRSVSSDHLKGSRPSYIRRGLAAIRIHSIVALECSLDLPPLPILPYSLALSMGVSYQQFRSSKLITHLNRTKTSLANCCALLEELSDYWFSAEAMARLGRTALHQMEGKLEYLSHPEENWLRDTSGGVNATGSLTEINATGESREDYGPSRGTPSVAGLEDNHDPLRISEPVTDSGDPGYDRFANIDMLFGDFLDLSLPTNFWDPVFSTEEPGEMQTQ